MEQRIQLSDHFGFGRLIRFTIPSILMMIFTSIYGVVDGYFVSNFVGKTPFAAVNFIMPFLMVVGAMGFMFGTGGSALIARIMGEGRREKAQEIFSLLIAATFVSGLVIAVISILFLPQIAAFLGAEGEMLADCIRYGRIILVALPFLMLQYAFGSLSVTAEKPKLGLIVTIISGVLNMTGDVLFMGVFHWGIAGAAMATAMGQIIGGTIPLVYFLRKNSSSLRLRRPKWDGGALRRACTNGVSELMSSISMSIVGMLYNAQLMRYAGENGVAAYGTIMYVDFIFLAIFIGYATGVAPVISYHYGAGNKKELNNLLKRSVLLIAAASLSMLLLSEVMAAPLAAIFVGYDAGLLDMTVHAYSIYAVSFLFCGFSIFSSAFFTALGDGLTSALIAFLRTLVFESASVIILPLLLGLNGIWGAIIVAECMSVTVSVIFLVAKRKRYQYF
ncbi:MATE family efflux transporter [Clostridium sp. AM28-20LB]|uniref:MATE family efflux transporter n=1 Tax=Clostridium sp. AM28-20LB TaxID=2293027 RepID=UPI000E4BFADC|nr:MATE family efflux transporter [Clostridium sp. AM28-20LB]RHT78026.1 MATE family efflux transporter [Clostridium sp. AM28-20LB]